MIVFGVWGSSLYIKSVQPAYLEKTIGSIAYDICTRMRNKSRYILSVSLTAFLVYNIYPIDIFIMNSKVFKSYMFAISISLIPLIPGILLFFDGRRALGKESMSPKKYRSVYNKGIYSYIRHPQHLGEIFFWYFLSLFLNSVFLIIFTTIFWIPNYILWCHYEEKDLLLRYGDAYKEYIKSTKKLIPFIY